ncbi:MAG TPA: PBP1A family penicillin-binding protein [Candidatus Methylomirabilis sp.]|nr:PBP1A family penicillin-binding protein [Candidatus Methylomirabilis sp.]
MPTERQVRGHFTVRRVAVIVAVAVAVTGAVALGAFSATELTRFARAEVRRTAVIYASGQSLTSGTDIRLVGLAATLARLGYTETPGRPTAPGQFHRSGAAWEIVLRGQQAAGVPPGARIGLVVEGDRIARVTRDGRATAGATLEGEVLAGGVDRPGEDYRPLRLAETPRSLVNAVLAAEDRRFFEHGPVDPQSLVRAAWTNLRAGRIAQGGSTITQQLIKIRLLTPHRTALRKLQEAWLALLVEFRYSKSQILEAYLNEVYLGQRGPLMIRGVGAASRAYFGKEAHQLSTGEAAVIAAMVRAPNTFSPALNPARARKGRDVVLAKMRQLGMLDDAEYERACREPVRVFGSPAFGQDAPYFVDAARQELEQRFDDAALRGQEDLSIFTTLDRALQRFAERAVAQGLDQLETRMPRLRRAAESGPLQAALVALDPATGEIRAMVGGRDYRTSQFNRAVMARRQPGSAFKPFVYAAALSPRNGHPRFTAASIVEDSPLTILVSGKPWTPRNFEDRYEGPVTLQRALEQSLNSATVRVAQAVGLKEVVQTAHAFGFGDNLAPVPAVALGAFEVTPIELGRAYLAFANAGVRPGGVTAVRAVVQRDDARAPAVEQEPPVRVTSPAEAYIMTTFLQGVIRSGTASSAQAFGISVEMAGKTGTTNEGRDAWFIGYSSRLLAVVWVGFDDGRPLRLTGAQAALPIWADFMRQAREAYPPPPFDMPAGVTLADIDLTNGLRANSFCPLVAREAFLAGTEPGPCHEHGLVPERVVEWWHRLFGWLRH